MTDEKILIVDDEPDMLENCARILGRNHYTCVTTSDPIEAPKLVSAEKPSVVLTDLKMLGKDGLELMRELKELDPSLIVIVFTAYASVSSAVEAMKEGAFDFIPKPFSADQLLVTMKRAFKLKKLEKENKNLRTQVEASYGFDKMIGNSSAITKVFEFVKKVAKTEANILIYGESGTGKELISQAIHFNSTRKDKSFIPLNCAALPETLLESELFGYLKGSFTGAVNDKKGLLEAADGGTLLLDEVNSMSINLQLKLLRFLQDRTFFKIGSTTPLTVDVRIIAVTNQDLENSVKKGFFREDLYHRLNVVCINLPPLRERKEDIFLLNKFFLHKYNTKYKKKLKNMSEDAFSALLKYSWPGNIRELQNTIEHAVILAENNSITIDDLPPLFSPCKDATNALSMSAVEKEHILSVLNLTKSNKKKASKLLAIDPATLWRKLKKYDIAIN